MGPRGGRGGSARRAAEPPARRRRRARADRTHLTATRAAARLLPAAATLGAWALCALALGACALNPGRPVRAAEAGTPASAADGGERAAPPPAAGARAAEQDAALLREARRLAAEGREEEALRLLRTAAPDGPGPGRRESGRSEIVEEARLQVDLLLGDYYYERKVYGEAFRLYREARQGATPRGAEAANRIGFRLAWIAWHERGDRDLSAWYFRPVDPRLLVDSERREWAYLGRRLAWQELSASSLSLEDGNVSALRPDRDDLWVGTWSGGLVRYSRSNGRGDVFWKDRESLEPNTVRAIEAAGTRVWVGTYQGLSVYSRIDSGWKRLDGFAGPGPTRVEAIREWDGRVYVGTLGRGLWVLDGKEWRQVRDEPFPGPYVSCLEVVQDLLAIGTLSLGVLLLDPSTGRLSSFDRVRPGLTARNITLLLYEPPGRLWIGTYGEGLYLWDVAGNLLQRFSKASGDMPDDWVLCGAVTPEGTWFGTFGGGLAFLDRNTGRWSRVGLAEGLPGLDVSALAAGPLSSLLVGTLGSGVAILDPSLLTMGNGGYGGGGTQ